MALPSYKVLNQWRSIISMSESPEVERGPQNPKGRSNLERGAEPPADNTDPTQPVEVASAEESPQGNQMRNLGKTDKIGTA
jgi:hypothetical protein